MINPPYVLDEIPMMGIRRLLMLQVTLEGRVEEYLRAWAAAAAPPLTATCELPITGAVPTTCALAPVDLDRLDRRLDPLRGR